MAAHGNIWDLLQKEDSDYHVVIDNVEWRRYPSLEDVDTVQNPRVARPLFQRLHPTEGMYYVVDWSNFDDTVMRWTPSIPEPTEVAGFGPEAFRGGRDISDGKGMVHVCLYSTHPAPVFHPTNYRPLLR